ncbi:hypothetical protein F5Y18DRAFT_284429 [Xylariaceae sp. FL1019]|nr:hypothetical protein F5Y18DRAFT_284429 [Xylariaceae sp. FL1019]
MIRPMAFFLFGFSFFFPNFLSSEQIRTSSGGDESSSLAGCVRKSASECHCGHDNKAARVLTELGGGHKSKGAKRVVWQADDTQADFQKVDAFDLVLQSV